MALAKRMILNLDESDWVMVAAAMDDCVKHQIRQSVPSIERILRDENQHPWIRGRAIVAIVRLNEQIELKVVRSLTKHDNRTLRLAAIESMGYLNSKETESLIADSLEDQSDQVRYQALASYAQRKGIEAWPVVDKLTTSIPKLAPPEVQRLAMRSLALASTPESLIRLSDWIDQGVSISRANLAIHDLRNPALIPILIKILSRTYVDGREYATLLTSLQRLPRKSVIEQMIDSVKSGKPSLIRTAARVNAKLLFASELGKPLFDAAKSMDEEGTIREILGTLGDRRMNPSAYTSFFKRHLNHSSSGIRTQAIRCLSHCLEVNLYEALKQAVVDKDPVVVRATLKALHAAPVDHVPRGKLVEYLQGPLSSDRVPEEREVSIRDLALTLLGKAGDKNDFAPALALLQDRLRSTDRHRRESAATALGQIAPLDAVANIAATQGYVTQWMVLGTFLNNRENEGFNKSLPPEEKIDFEATYKAKYIWTLEGHSKGEIEREISWKKAVVDATHGKLVVPQYMPPPASLSVGFAVADFQCEKQMDVILDIDGDDSFRVWLNGTKIAERIGEYKRHQPSVATHKGIEVKLNKGANRLIVKTSNIDHDWWIRVRITDVAGHPIEVAR